MNKRLNLRMTDDLYDKIVHHSDKFNISLNDFIIRSIEHYINYILLDYSLAPLEVQRLNAMIDSVNTNTLELKKLEEIIVSQSKTILNMIQDDDSVYFIDEIFNE